RVSENEQQVRLLKSLMEENQRKLDNLLKMLEDLRKALYRHWGLSYSPAPRPSGNSIRIEPPSAPPPAASSRPAGMESPTGSEVEAPPMRAAEPQPLGDERAYAAAKERYDSEDYE